MEKYIYHYTSADSFLNMLHIPNASELQAVSVNKDADYGYYLDFHASDIHVLNDRFENNMIAYISRKMPDKLKQHAAFCTDVTGRPFVISFCKKSDYLPMWNIYTDKRRGICLKFRTDALVEKVNKINDSNFVDIKAEDCAYLSRRQFGSNVKKIVEKLGQTADSFTSENDSMPVTKELCDIIMQSAFYKSDYFEYEHEFRLAAFVSIESKTKAGKYGILQYYPIKIPLTSLEEIIIGPSDNQDLLEYSVKQFLHNKNIDRLHNYGIDIKVSCSKLQLRRV